MTEEDDPEMTTQPDGTREWRRNGKRHRDGGPAIEWFDGTKVWFRHDLLHREDGPAYEGRDGAGDNQYYLFGKELSYDEFRKQVVKIERGRQMRDAHKKAALMVEIEKSIELQEPVTVKGPLRLKKNQIAL